MRRRGGRVCSRRSRAGRREEAVLPLILWQRPPEPAVRAVSTLAQFGGAERVKKVQAVADAQIKKRLKVSFALVDHASVGDVDKMRLEVRRAFALLTRSPPR